MRSRASGNIFDDTFCDTFGYCQFVLQMRIIYDWAFARFFACSFCIQIVFGTFVAFSVLFCTSVLATVCSLLCKD